MKRWKVKVYRTVIQPVCLGVEADDAESARRAALKLVGSGFVAWDWPGEEVTDYQAEPATEYVPSETFDTW